MKRLQVVVDPNLIISLLIGKRVSKLLSVFSDERFEVVLHEELLGEFEEVARRTKFRKYFPEAAVDAFIAQLRSEGRVIDRVLVVEKVCRDPDDDYLLALAKAAKADVLLTGDADLLVLGKHGRTRILNVRAFVKEYL